MSLDVKELNKIITVVETYINNLTPNDKSLGLGISGAASGASELYKRQLICKIIYSVDCK